MNKLILLVALFFGGCASVAPGPDAEAVLNAYLEHTEEAERVAAQAKQIAHFCKNMGTPRCVGIAEYAAKVALKSLDRSITQAEREKFLHTATNLVAMLTLVQEDYLICKNHINYRNCA